MKVSGSRELDAVLAEPEDPVKLRLNQIRKNRKKAEENRIGRMRKIQDEEEMIREIAVELDQMAFMLHDMVNGLKNFNVRMRWSKLLSLSILTVLKSPPNS